MTLVRTLANLVVQLVNRLGGYLERLGQFLEPHRGKVELLRIAVAAARG
jgi:hypothetical protein